MIGVSRTRLEIKVFVEGLRVVIFCVDQKSADAGDVRSLGRTQERILEQSLPKALPGLARRRLVNIALS